MDLIKGDVLSVYFEDGATGWYRGKTRPRPHIAVFARILMLFHVPHRSMAGLILYAGGGSLGTVVDSFCDQSSLQHCVSFDDSEIIWFNLGPGATQWRLEARKLHETPVLPRSLLPASAGRTNAKAARAESKLPAKLPANSRPAAPSGLHENKERPSGGEKKRPRDEDPPVSLPSLPKLPPKPVVQDEWTFDDFSDEEEDLPAGASAPSLAARPSKQPKNTFNAVVVESIHRLVQNISAGCSTVDAD
jgi:hypothetical protein